MVARWRGATLGLGLLALACACGGEPAAKPQPGSGGSGGSGANGGSGGERLCRAGQLELEGSCIDAGLPTGGCGPGSWDDQGSCQEAGIPASACAEGFVADGDHGCAAVLPDEVCPSGTMATPGETACHELAPCGDPPWGLIPVESDSLYVDASYVGGDSDGSAAKPWTTVQQALVAAPPGALVAVAAGSYPGPMTIDQPVRLWGRCPALVELTGTNGNVLAVTAGADHAEVHDLAVTGDVGWAAIAIHDASDVLVQGLWLHDTDGSRGFDITEGASAPTAAILRDVLIERARVTSIMVWGADAVIERTVVRDTAGDGAARALTVSSNTATGRAASGVVRASVFEHNGEIAAMCADAFCELEGVVIRDTAPELSTGDEGLGLLVVETPDWGGDTVVQVRGSLIEGSHDTGILQYGGDLDIDATVVRDTLPHEPSQERGWGVASLPPEPPAPTSLRVSRSLVERNHEAAILAVGAEAVVQGTLMRETASTPASGRYGYGLVASDGLDEDDATALTLTGCAIVDNHDVGLLVAGSEVEVDGLWVRQTWPRPVDGSGGDGIQVARGFDGDRSLASIRGSLIEGSHTGGVSIYSADVTLHQCVVRDTATDPASQHFGNGVAAMLYSPVSKPSSLELSATRIETSHQVGLLIDRSDVTVRGSVIDSTAARPADGAMGDAVAFFANQVKGTLAVYDSWLGGSARAGLSSFGGAVEIGGCTLWCNPIHLDGEVFGGLAYAFTDLGGNECGCGEETELCKVMSSQLTPPEPPPDSGGLPQP